MQLFIGGAHAGKRALIRRWFTQARWYEVAEAGPGSWRSCLVPDAALVVTGWEHWLVEWLGTTSTAADDDSLRQAIRDEFQALSEAERQYRLDVILVVEEMGRGVVPMGRERRRLRDLNGWLAQDAAARCARVWYVRHGLYRSLKPLGE